MEDMFRDRWVRGKCSLLRFESISTCSSECRLIKMRNLAACSGLRILIFWDGLMSCSRYYRHSLVSRSREHAYLKHLTWTVITVMSHLSKSFLKQRRFFSSLMFHGACCGSWSGCGYSFKISRWYLSVLDLALSRSVLRRVNWRRSRRRCFAPQQHSF